MTARKVIPFRHEHSDYHFLRQHTGSAPEPIRPLRSWLQEIARLIIVGLMCYALYLLLAVTL